MQPREKQWDHEATDAVEDTMDLEERTRALEVSQARTEVLLESYIDEQRRLRQTLTEELGKINTSLTRFRGFLAGVSFVAAGVWALLLAAIGGVFKGWFGG